MGAVLLVPRRADGGHRDRVWEFCRAFWESKHPDLPIYEGVHEAVEGPFSRSIAVNRAAAQAEDWDMAIVIDADVLIDAGRIHAGITLAERCGRVVFPFRIYQSLSQVGTSRIMAGWKGDWTKVATRARWDSVSCVVIVPRAVWDQVGGMDARFSGWGFEDSAASSACDSAVGGHLRLAGTLWHLWHPPSSERNRHTSEYQSNKALEDRYRFAAQVSWEAMQAVLSEPGGPLASLRS